MNFKTCTFQYYTYFLFGTFALLLTNCGEQGLKGGLALPDRSNDETPIEAPHRDLKRKVLVLGISGTTGNQFHEAVFNKNLAPSLLELAKTGKYTLCTKATDERCARTHQGPRFDNSFEWKGAPGWGSVLTGAQNKLHQIKNNDHSSMSVFTQTSKSYPTFLATAKKYGLKTAAGGVSAFLTSNKAGKVDPGILDYECGVSGNGPTTHVDAHSSCNLDHRLSLKNSDGLRDQKLTQFMENKIREGTADVVMGVLDRIDEAGHKRGFDSNHSYLKAIAEADALAGILVKAIKEVSKVRDEEWLVIVTSDHGGHRFLFWGDHGKLLNEDEVVPFVVTTFGSKEKLLDLQYPVTHMDVNPTLLRWLGLPVLPLDGRVQAIR